MNKGSEVCLRNERSLVEPELGNSEGMTFKWPELVIRGQVTSCRYL